VHFLLFYVHSNVVERACTEAEFINVQFRLMFLGIMDIILRVLRLEVSVWISYTIGKGLLFHISFSFFLYSVQLCTVTHYRNFKRLREFEAQTRKSKCKAVEVTLNSKEKNSEDFCLDLIQEFDLSRSPSTLFVLFLFFFHSIQCLYFLSESLLFLRSMYVVK
jgi:hypothetical protein